MKEDLLQYIWKFQYYNNHELRCTNGDEILVIHPGSHNQNQGPKQGKDIGDIPRVLKHEQNSEQDQHGSPEEVIASHRALHFRPCD